MNIVNKKICRYCQQEKELEAFVKCPKCKDGYNYRCKECTKESKKDYLKEYHKEYYKENKNLYQEYYKKNKEEKLDYQKEYVKLNRHIKRASDAKRRASKLNATPKWLSQDQLYVIKKFYELAKLLESLTDIKYHVDHIVPLQGENVCGLHVPWNLQVITAEENLNKSNKFEN